MTAAILAITVAVAGCTTDSVPAWQVGFARVRITPDGPMPMCGYGPRISDGVLDDLYAKAMAIELPGGDRAVLVTADLLFFRRDVAEAVAKRIMEKTGLEAPPDPARTPRTRTPGPWSG